MVTRRTRLAIIVTALVTACTGTPGTVGAAPGVWTTLPELPEPRTEVTAAIAGDLIYAVGGFAADPAGTVIGSRRVDVFDLTTDSWSRAPDLPIALHHAAAVSLGERIVVVGGYTTVGFVPTPTTWVLEPGASAWEPFVALPEPRGAHVAVSDGASIWVAGGVGLTGLTDEVLVLDPGADAWRAVAPLPDTREHLAGALLDGVFYVAGGRDGPLSSNTARADAYDIATDTWERVADMPTARGGIAAAAHDGRVVVFGGEANSGTFDEAEAYDPTSGGWTSLTPMPTARHGLGAVTSARGTHVIGGGPQPGLFFGGAHEVLTDLD